MPSRLGGLKMTTDVVELGARREKLVALGELADDLVGRVPPTLGHSAVLFARSWG
jgi:hypothetical protein